MLLPSDLVVDPQPLAEGPQPMEVVQAQNCETVGNQASYKLQASKFTWSIENFSQLKTTKLYSDIFVVGGYKWRVLIFPEGNRKGYLSMYLEVADLDSLPYGCSRYARFSMAIVNLMQSKMTIREDTEHQFNQRESDWGFDNFMLLSKLHDLNKGYLVNDNCIVEVAVAVRKVIDHQACDSKKETDDAELKNQELKAKSPNPAVSAPAPPPKEPTLTPASSQCENEKTPLPSKELTLPVETGTNVSQPESSKPLSKGKEKILDHSLEVAFEEQEDDLLDVGMAISNQFYSMSAEWRHCIFEKMEFLCEKELNVKQFKQQKVFHFIEAGGLERTVSEIIQFCPRIVREFYSNLTLSMKNPLSPRLEKVFCRNRVCNFSPEVINSYLGLGSVPGFALDDNLNVVTSSLTGGRLDVWPKPGLSHSDLIYECNLLHKVSMFDWTPTTNKSHLTPTQAMFLYRVFENKPLDFGEHVFNLIMEFAQKPDVLKKLPFPSLIWGILKSQNVVMLERKGDVLHSKPQILKVTEPPQIIPSAVPEQLHKFIEQQMFVLDSFARQVLEQKAYYRSILQTLGHTAPAATEDDQDPLNFELKNREKELEKEHVDKESNDKDEEDEDD